MASLTVGGVNIKVAVSSPRWTRSDAVDRARAFDNTFRASQTGGAVRTWDFETPPVLAATEGETYKAALSTIASQLCSGDIIAIPTMCSAELTDGVPTSVAGDPYVVLSFTLHEVQPAKILLRYAPGDTITGESFTASTTRRYFDSSLIVRSAAINAKRDAHYTSLAGTRSLLMEDARTNWLLRSEEFDNATWAKTNITVTADNTAAPDGTSTADKIAATASAATQIIQAVTAPSTGSYTYSLFIKQGSGATDGNSFAIRNNTTATNLLIVTVNYSTGAIAYVVGSTGATMQALDNGWWLLTLSVASGITAGDSIICYAGFTGGGETAGEYLFAWGAQLEYSPFPSSYVPTTAGSVNKTASTYSLPFTEPPKEMTVYVKFVEKGTLSLPAAGILEIGALAGTEPLFLIYNRSISYAAYHGEGAAGGVFSQLAAAPTLGQTVELAARLYGDGSVQIAQSINGANETTATQSGALALSSAWSAQTMFLNVYATSLIGFSAFHSVKIVAGARSLAELRTL